MRREAAPEGGREEPLPDSRFTLGLTKPSRVGRHVHRASGEWTPVVHALLRHLEDVGFDGAPRVVGFDEAGREVLTYLDGEAGSAAFPPALLVEKGLVELGSLLRSFHDAARSFQPAPDAVYAVGHKPVGPGQIVCHRDAGFFNTVWQGDRIVGLIDWDMAEPAAPISDVAQAATTVVPFADDDVAARLGLVPPIDRERRLAALCAGYGGITPREVVEAARDEIRLEIERLGTFGKAGREPWATGLAGGRQLPLFRGIAAWLDANEVPA